MKKENVKFLRCEHCGNMVGFIEDKGVDVICCGEPMKTLDAKDSDVGVEKHLPVLEKVGDKLSVTVGQVLHPMTEEHYIQWVAVVADNHTERIAFTPAEEPKAVFCSQGEADVYAYCNLHGLWKVSV